MGSKWDAMLRELSEDFRVIAGQSSSFPLHHNALPSFFGKSVQWLNCE
jgi:hypothetical protein